MSTHFSNNLLNIVHSPSSIVPSLTARDIVETITKSIRAYIDKEIDLETLVDMSTKIKIFSGMRERTDRVVDITLGKLAALSKYLNNEKNREDDIHKDIITILNGISRS